MARPGNGRQLRVVSGACDECLYEVAWRERPAAAPLESEADDGGRGFETTRLSALGAESWKLP